MQIKKFSAAIYRSSLANNEFDLDLAMISSVAAAAAASKFAQVHSMTKGEG